MRSGGGEERSMTRLRLAPGSLWGPLQSPPFTRNRLFLSPLKFVLFCFFIFLFQIFLPSLSLGLLLLSDLKKNTDVSRANRLFLFASLSSASSCLFVSFHVSLNSFSSHTEYLIRISYVKRGSGTRKTCKHVRW